MSSGGGMSPVRWGGGEAAVGLRVSRQPPSWTARWWARQNRARLARSVGPPWSQWRRWWASHQARGRSQSGKTQPPSRTARAVRWAGWTTRVARPTSSGWVGAPPRVGGSRAIAARSRAASPSRPAGVVPTGVLGVRVVSRSLLGWVVAGGLRWCLAAGVVAGMGGRGVACDQHPGHRPITSQSPTRLGVQWSSPPDLTTHRIGVAQEAVQVHGHGQLRADPTGLGQPPALQAAAGQLGQGIGVALATAAGVGGVGGAGQRLQRGQEGLAGFGFQQPIDRHHAFEGGGEPQAPTLMTSFSVVVGAVGVGHLEQVA